MSTPLKYTAENTRHDTSLSHIFLIRINQSRFRVPTPECWAPRVAETSTILPRFWCGPTRVWSWIFDIERDALAMRVQKLYPKHCELFSISTQTDCRKILRYTLVDLPIVAVWPRGRHIKADFLPCHKQQEGREVPDWLKHGHWLSIPRSAFGTKIKESTVSCETQPIFLSAVYWKTFSQRIASLAL